MKTLRTVAILVGLSLVASVSAFAANHSNGHNWYGGPIYSGQPDLQLTAALVKAGGGPAHFKFSTALVSMLGQKTVNAEVAKLTKQYGQKNVDDFLSGMTFVINDALKRATAAGVKLPAAPPDLKGQKLAVALVKAGTAPDGTFWAGHLFDKTVSHKIHDEVMSDVNRKFSPAADQNAHKILNQAMYDVAHALGHGNVQLASLH
jgi:hypothetical protein